MCRVGECFLRLDDAKGAETWYQKARKLGEKHGCYAVECSASLGLGQIEFYIHKRMPEAAELLRHALSVLDFVEGQDETLERNIKDELAKVFLHTGRYEEAGPLIQRVHELAEMAGADPLEMVMALELAVGLQMRMGNGAQAAKDMQVLPARPRLSPPPERYSEPGSYLAPLTQAPTRSGRPNPSGVHLLHSNPRRAGAAWFASAGPIPCV
ncbi:hypothetical protein T484DRAFT_1743127 [Baffinella frigidus]|nr:hypothetical protein T484DRAFT_1743127 [Cryptophyta sp. CCMP2293]